MIIKNLFKVTLALTICNFSFGQGFDMGGPPKKKKEKQRSDVSPNKQGFSAVQKKYQNQIVFSNSDILESKENPANFIDSWNLSDPLFFRVYMTNTLEQGVFDYQKSKGKEFNEYYFADFALLTVVTINGKEVATRESKLSKKDKVTEWVSIGSYVKNAGNSKLTSGSLGVALKRALHTIGDDYKVGALLDVKFDIYAVDAATYDRESMERPKSDRTSLLSSGKLKIKATKEGMNEYAPILCYKTLKNGNSMVDLDLEKRVMVKFNQSYNDEVTDANITSEDWNIIKNVYGVPLRRNLSTNVTYVNDGKEYITEYFINQTYNGNGYQKSVNSSSVGETRPYSPTCKVYKKELNK